MVQITFLIGGDRRERSTLVSSRLLFDDRGEHPGHHPDRKVVSQWPAQIQQCAPSNTPPASRIRAQLILSPKATTKRGDRTATLVFLLCTDSAGCYLLPFRPCSGARGRPDIEGCITSKSGDRILNQCPFSHPITSSPIRKHRAQVHAVMGSPSREDAAVRLLLLPNAT